MTHGNCRTLFLLLALASLVLCHPSHSPEEQALEKMNAIAEAYVTLSLAMGLFDGDYVDAYYGPPEWREEAIRRAPSLAEIKSEARELAARLAAIDAQGAPEMSALRHHYLGKQLGAMLARIDFLEGSRPAFDEETRLLYDAVAPHYPASHFQALLAELAEALPGEGTLDGRLADFQAGFVIPPDKLDAVFQAAIAEARRRTAAKIELPAEEHFTVEYVTDKAWSGYNWYQGNATSIIQVNTDFPIHIDRAIDLACHEGYPGHHVYNLLLEQHLAVARGFREFTIYPLFSPQSLIAEGSANFGIEVAFPSTDRIAFEKQVLFPLAGLDPATADHYYRGMAIVGRLSYAGNEAARGFLDGTMDRDQAVDWLVNYGLYSRKKAAQRIAFIQKYRSYVINYNLGKDLVADFVNRNGGTADHPDRRWEVFANLLSSPRLPSQLLAEPSI